ncbi:MAG TPA: hypothetical protein VJX16_07590 [Terriglobales bacterium]|nr:hypothetical protein [Terriglobales bacterium]
MVAGFILADYASGRKQNLLQGKRLSELDSGVLEHGSRIGGVVVRDVKTATELVAVWKASEPVPVVDCGYAYEKET